MSEATSLTHQLIEEGRLQGKLRCINKTGTIGYIPAGTKRRFTQIFPQQKCEALKRQKIEPKAEEPNQMNI